MSIGISFFQTMMGRKFYEDTVPALVGHLQSIASELKRYNDAQEVRSAWREMSDPPPFGVPVLLKLSEPTYDEYGLATYEPGGLNDDGDTYSPAWVGYPSATWCPHRAGATAWCHLPTEVNNESRA
jgi:hypothetical protein